MGAHPGLTHDAVLGWATSVKGKVLDTLVPWPRGHLPPPLMHIPLVFPNHIWVSACSVTSSVTMPRFRQIFVEGMSVVQSDLP